MLEKSYQQFAIVQADSATVLSDLLNAKLRDLKDKTPTVTFDGNTARISYVETVEEPEDIEDAFRLKGVELKCGACPFFEAVEKSDGTKDERAKKGKCPCAKFGIAFSDGPACETLYRMLNEGEVELCLRK